MIAKLERVEVKSQRQVAALEIWMAKKLERLVPKFFMTTAALTSALWVQQQKYIKNQKMGEELANILVPFKKIRET